jgi:hypothetical protein
MKPWSKIWLRSVSVILGMVILAAALGELAWSGHTYTYAVNTCERLGYDRAQLSGEGWECVVDTLPHYDPRFHEKRLITQYAVAVQDAEVYEDEAREAHRERVEYEVKTRMILQASGEY